MANQPTDLVVTYPYPPIAANRAAGGFTKDSSEVIGRAVQLDSDGSVRLVADDVKPFGSIMTLTASGVGVGLGPYITVKQNGTTKLPIGLGVTGATKVVVSGGTAERGFVKSQATPSTIVQAINELGIVTDSEDTTADSEGEATTEIYVNG